jgi:hypothetical protein
MRVPAVRLEGWMLALGLAVAAMPLLLSLDQGLNFSDDEWNYATVLQTQGFSLLRPYGEHWYAVPNMIWSVLLSTVGMRSYMPYVAVLLTMHIATCLVLFVLIRRRAGSTVALVSMAVLLFNNGGGEVIFWALMVSYLGSTLGGLLALLLLDGPATDWRRAILAAVLLLVGTASSGMGLGFLVAATVELAVDPDRRRYLAALLLPAAGFVAWYAFFGVHTSQVVTVGSFWQTAGLYAGYVLGAVLAGSAAIFGLPAVAGPLAAGAAGLIAVIVAVTRRVDHRSLGLLAGLLVQFTLVAMIRAAGGFSLSRYVYIASIYVLLLFAPAAARVFAARWPWKIAPVSLAVFAVAINVCGLGVYTQIHRATTDYQRVELQTVDAFRGSPDLRQDVLIDDALPSASSYFALTAAFGSPVAQVSQADVGLLPHDPVDRALSRVLRIRSAAATAPPAAAGCTETAGAGGALVLAGRSGSSFDVGAAPGTRVRLFLWLLDGPQQQPTASLTMPAFGWEAISLPRTSQPVTWHLSVQAAGPAQAWACAQAGAPHS